MKNTKQVIPNERRKKIFLFSINVYSDLGSEGLSGFPVISYTLSTRQIISVEASK